VTVNFIGSLRRQKKIHFTRLDGDGHRVAKCWVGGACARIPEIFGNFTGFAQESAKNGTVYQRLAGKFPSPS
jgi:hypothetical protein